MSDILRKIAFCKVMFWGLNFSVSSYSGLREMASIVNRNVTYWWRTEFADLANVYTLHDFVVSTDMVQVAIERNLLLAKKRKINP